MSAMTEHFVIDDKNVHLFLPDAPDEIVNGIVMHRGLVPRDFNENPVGTMRGSVPFSIADIPLIPWEEIPERIKEKEAKKTRLSDMIMTGNYGSMIPSLDQNGQGYCWSYSTVGCVHTIRALMNLPYIRMSAHSVACVIKEFRDQGGWGGQSFEFICERGVMPISLWPEKSMSHQYNTAANWLEAAKYKITEGFVDLDAPIYDRNMSAQQQLSCLLMNIPLVGDHNWWGHSVSHLDAVDCYPEMRFDNPLRYGHLIRNSWTDAWKKFGMGILAGKQGIADSCLGPRLVLAA